MLYHGGQNSHLPDCIQLNEEYCFKESNHRKYSGDVIASLFTHCLLYFDHITLINNPAPEQFRQTNIPGVMTVRFIS